MFKLQMDQSYCLSEIDLLDRIKPAIILTCPNLVSIEFMLGYYFLNWVLNAAIIFIFFSEELEIMKERFAKLLLGEDMSGSGKGVCTAVTISNAITNLYGILLDPKAIVQSLKFCFLFAPFGLIRVKMQRPYLGTR